MDEAKMSGKSIRDVLIGWLEEDAIHRGKLACIFKSLSVNSHGVYSTKHTKMTVQRFEFFVDDFFFYTSTFSRKDFISFISNKFDQHSSVSTILGTPHNRIFLSFKNFLGLLVDISFMRNRGKKSMKSLKKILKIIYESEKYQQYKNLLPLSLWNELKELKKVFFQYDNLLRRLFKHFSSKYATNSSQTKVSKMGRENTKGSSKERSMIKYPDLVRFCQKLHMSQSGTLTRGVSSISQFEIRRIYRSLFSHSYRSEPNQIDFDTFRTFLTRLALFFFVRPSVSECHKANNVLVLMFFRKFIHPLFRKVYPGRDIKRYLVDLDSIPPPQVLDLTPDYSSFESNSLIRIRGRGFDFRKGGVYLKIKTPVKEINVPCRYLDEEESSDNNDSEFPENLPSPEDEFDVFTPKTTSVFRQFTASNFDELIKRTQNMQKYVRQRETEIVCNVPTIDPNEEVRGTKLIVLIQPAKGSVSPNIIDPHYPRTKYRYCYEVRVFNYLRVHASVTNDMEVYCPKPMDFYYVDRMEPFLIGAEITVLILEYFRTFQFLDIEKWEGLKKFIRKRLSSQCIFKDPTKKELNLQYSVIQSVRGGEESENGSNCSETPSDTSSDDDDEKGGIGKKKMKSRRKYVLGVNEESRCTASGSLASLSHRINGTISLERFLKLLVVFSMTEVQGLHPLDFLINLIQLHQVVKNEEEYVLKERISKPPPTTYQRVIAKSSGLDIAHPILGRGGLGRRVEEEEELENRMMKMSLYLRYRREFDVYYGPILIGMIYERGKGHLSSSTKKNIRGRRRNNNNYLNMEDVLQVDCHRTSFLKSRMTIENAWFGYTQYNSIHERTVTRVIEFSENFDHLISRFLGYGFDLTTAYWNTTSRNPIGRNWQILLSKDGGEQQQQQQRQKQHLHRKKKEKTEDLDEPKEEEEEEEEEDGEGGERGEEKKEEEERMGVLLDYDGQFGTLKWNPSCTDLLSKNYTLCCYSPIEERANYFLEVFRKSKSLKELRLSMERNGYRFCLKIC